MFLEAIKIAHEANQEIIRIQEELQKIHGKPKIELKAAEVPSDLATAITSEFGDKITSAVTQSDKVEREDSEESIKQEIIEKLKDSFPETDIEKVVEAHLRQAARKFMLENKTHLDGRQYNEIRPLKSEVGLLPRTHGSALFTRGTKPPTKSSIS